MAKTHLRVQTQEDDHDEEEDTPQGRHGHLRHGFRVGDEGEAGSALRHLPDMHALLVRHKAQNAEYHEPGKERRSGIRQRKYYAVSVQRKVKPYAC